MRRAPALALMLSLMATAPARADSDPQPAPPSQSAGGSAGAGQFDIGLAESSQGERRSPSEDAPAGESDSSSYSPKANTSGACVGAGEISVIAGSNGPEITYCPADAAPAVVTIGMVRTAFASLPLPGSKLTIQPPDGLTLVNFDTNFYTADTQAITSNVTLLGQAVTIEATPDQFTWHFGDDTTKTTTDPGAAYPDLRVTHNYLKKATYRPSLTTTYTGRFKVGNTPWRTIPGTVTINGPKQRLRAIEATPKLTGY